MQCAYCGATLKPGSKVCDACGAEVAPANLPAPSVSEEPIPEAFPYAEADAQAVETPVATSVAEQVTPAPVSFADILIAAPNTAPVNNRSLLAIASLVLGVIGLCSSFFALCGAPVSVIGIILGITSLKSSNRNLAVAGIVLNGVGLLMAVLFTILIGAMGYISTLPGN
jgi:hypothetical protein